MDRGGSPRASKADRTRKRELWRSCDNNLESTIRDGWQEWKQKRELGSQRRSFHTNRRLLLGASIPSLGRIVRQPRTVGVVGHLTVLQFVRRV
jgi:hypothetical protein